MASGDWAMDLVTDRKKRAKPPFFEMRQRKHTPFGPKSVGLAGDTSQGISPAGRKNPGP